MFISLSERLTYSTVLIECEYNDGSFGSGTGFLTELCYDEDNQKCIPVLITNKHVVENSINTTFSFCKSDNNSNPIDTESVKIKYESPKWINHPDASVDLVCLPIAPILTKFEQDNTKIFYAPIPTNIIPSEEKLNKLTAIEDVIMIGYPIGISDQYNHKPIIRRGITATHPRNNYQGKKEILLDMSCYPGSSGSPVFILNEGTYTTGNSIIMGNRIYLLGILYGGPQFDNRGILDFHVIPNSPTPIISMPINLGIIIKSERILEFENLLNQISVL